MDKRIIELKKLTELDAVPGNEKECRLYMEARFQELKDIEISYDNIGSIIGKKVGDENGPRVMIAGHMDEVGFMITEITKEGFLKFATLGGWWSQVMLAQQVKVTTRSGKKVYGVLGSKPPHILKPEERAKPADIDAMYIDIGVASKEEAEAAGIRIGDMVTPYMEFKEMENKDYLVAKAFDNRIGCAIVIDVLEELEGEKHPNTIYSVGTVQEEVGCRGAKTTANMINPDIAFSLDVGIANDAPGGDGKGKMGDGPIITLKDASMVGHKGLRDFVIDLCEELNIPFQLGFLNGGGTDAGPMHLAHNGAPSMAIGIASRYIHSHTSMIHKQDYLNAVKLLKEVLKRLDSKTVKDIIFA